jgi:hypothetical protein
MGKIGRFVTDPKAGAYCKITLDSGEKILVSHDKGDLAGGRLTIHTVKWLGFGSSEMLLSLDLDLPAGREALARLTAGAPKGSSEATPIGALVAHVQGCRSIEEVRSRCGSVAATS